jgi:hypothetical protein
VIDCLNVFISQPMNGKNDSEIKGERHRIEGVIDNVLKTNYNIIDSYFEDYNPNNGCVSLKYLSKSLELLADADVVFFASGWEDARGCKIEHDCAKAYNIMIIEE